MSDDIPKMSVEHLCHVEPWGSEPKEDNGWHTSIPPEDRHDRNILLANEEGRMSTGYYCSPGMQFVPDDQMMVADEITCWCELPPMLKEQAE